MPHSNTGIKTTHITDATGNLIAEYSYDAWGRMRNPETWECTIENNQLSIAATTVTKCSPYSA